MAGRRSSAKALMLAAACAAALAGCASGPPELPTELADLEVETLADAAPLVEAGAAELYVTWLQDDGVRYTDVADPADPERADWRVIMVCGSDDGQQMLFVPPEQFDELAEAGITECDVPG